MFENYCHEKRVSSQLQSSSDYRIEQLLQGSKWELVFTFQSHFVDFSQDH